MYESAFSYNLTRPYPYRWFTWVVTLGGIVATVLFSTINLAANGYNSTIVYSSNPNQTINNYTTGVLRQRPWSFASKVPAKCQDQVVSLGSAFSTNTGLFLYTITSIGRADSDGKPRQSLSFTYHNNPLNCIITHLNLKNTPATEITDPGDNPFIKSIIIVTAIINCTVVENDPRALNYFTLALEERFDDFSDTYIRWDGLRINGQEQSLSLWGELLLTTYSSMILSKTHNAGLLPLEDLSPDIDRAGWSISNYEDNPFMTAIELQNPSGRFHIGNFSGHLRNNVTYNDWSSAYGADLVSLYNFGMTDYGFDMTDPPPGSLDLRNDKSLQLSALTMDSLGKILYSLIQIDLGQTYKPQIFNGSEEIWKVFNSTLSFFSNSTMYLISFGLQANQSNYFFNDSLNKDPDTLFKWAGTEIPRVHYNPFIDAIYLCQVPELKPPGSLAISIIVADLILLQALWTLFVWCTKSVMERRDRTVNHCACCTHATCARNDKDDTAIITQTTPLLKVSCSDVIRDQSESVPIMASSSPVIKRRPVATPRTASLNDQT